MVHKLILSVMCLAVANVSPALAALGIGDKAPELTIAEWVSGQPVSIKEGKGKNIFVIEFWATWCGPCRESIPHLTELQKKHRKDGLIAIGISDEPVATVKPFVATMGGKMDYAVACDKDKATGIAYMAAANQMTIPTTFIINKEGVIAWIGHPLMGMDEALTQIIAGKYNIDLERRIYGEVMQIQSLAHQGDWNGVIKSCQGLVKQMGDGQSMSLAGLLNSVSWTLITEKSIGHKYDKEALALAQAGFKACGENSPAVADTLARALFITGDKEGAIKYQKKAVELAENESFKAQLAEVLAAYEKGELTKAE